MFESSVVGSPEGGVEPYSLEEVLAILCEQRIRLMVFSVKDGFGVGEQRLWYVRGERENAPARGNRQGTHKGCPYGVWNRERCACTAR